MQVVQVLSDEQVEHFARQSVQTPLVVLAKVFVGQLAMQVSVLAPICLKLGEVHYEHLEMEVQVSHPVTQLVQVLVPVKKKLGLQVRHSVVG